MPQSNGPLDFDFTGVHDLASVRDSGQGVAGCQRLQHEVHFFEQNILLGQATVDVDQLVFLAFAIINVERDTDEASPQILSIPIHDFAVVGVPDPGSILGADSEFTPVRGGFACQVVIDCLLENGHVIWMDDLEDFINAGHGLVRVITQFAEYLVYLAGHFTADQIVFPEIKPGRLKRESQSFLVDIWFLHRDASARVGRLTGVADISQ